MNGNKDQAIKKKMYIAFKISLIKYYPKSTKLEDKVLFGGLRQKEEK